MTIKSEKESSWKAESVIGWSAAQREIRGYCMAVPIGIQWPDYSFEITQSVYNTGGERGEIFYFHLLHSRQASGSWRSHRRKRAFSLSLASPPPSLIACSLPEQTTDSHRTEFVFDVRQVWCFAESPVTLLYPPTQSFTEQLKTTSKKSHKEKEKE